MSDIYPKPRTGKECKQVKCIRHEAYKAWRPGDSSLNFCMECKYSHLSQFKRITPTVMRKV